MRNWIINPNGVGATDTNTNQKTKLLCCCHLCECIGYDHDGESVSELDLEPDEMNNIQGDESGCPTCDECASLTRDADVTFSLEITDLVTSIDLTEEASQLEEEAEIAYITVYDDGIQRGWDRGQVVFFPELHRAGISWGGDPEWTDADSIEDAVERSLQINGKFLCN
jgi:hypothetical protein